MNNAFHCPLCTSGLDPNAAYLFLDIDGVFIDRTDSRINDKIQETVQKNFPKEKTGEFSGLHIRIAASEHFYPDNMENFKCLVERVQKKRKFYIVLSSEWRNEGTLDEIRQKMFGTHECISKNIIGKTPACKDDKPNPEKDSGYDFETIAKKFFQMTSFKSRGELINFWLRFHGLQNADFAIVDDCEFDLALFGRRFVQTLRGFTPEVTERILTIFNIPIQGPSIPKSIALKTVAMKSKPAQIKNNPASKPKAPSSLLKAKTPSKTITGRISTLTKPIPSVPKIVAKSSAKSIPSTTKIVLPTKKQ
jgi:hypothetical protein